MEDIDWEKAKKIFDSDRDVLLQKLAREEGRYPKGSEILSLLAAGTLVSAAILIPGLPKIAPLLWSGKGYKNSRFKQTLKRFHKQGLVEVAETRDGSVVRITKNGFTKALRYKLDEMQVKKQKSWDKKWRIVIFDIPESKRKLRDAFRERLKQMGFVSLQKSVYVHAFPCFDEVEFLRQIYSVDISVTYILGHKIEEQDNLQKLFEI